MYNAMSKNRPTGGLVYANKRDKPELLESLIEEKTTYGHDDLALALHAAAETGNDECAKILLRHKAMPNIHDNRGLTPLLIAAKFGHENVLETLLTVGCNVNKPSFRVRATALHWAATNGHVECVKKLLEFGAKPEALTAQSRTPLMMAARSDEVEVVTLLVDAGAVVGKRDYSKATALHLAAEEGSLDCVKALLRAGADINCQMKNGDTPLTLAAQRGHVNTVRELVRRAYVDLDLCCRQLNALQWAADSGHLQCIEALLHAGIDPNFASKESYCRGDFIVNRGVTALMLAGKGGHTDCCRRLVQAGASVDAYDNDNLTALLYATKYNHSDCVTLLVEFGSDVDGILIDKTPGDEAMTTFEICPLLMASERNCADALTSLLKANANVDMLGYGSWHQHAPLTAFEIALIQGHYNVCQMLVTAGYSVKTINRDVLEEVSVLLAHSDEMTSRWLAGLLSTPWQLAQLCRKCIRKCLGRRLLKNVHKLPLPSALIAYINLCDLSTS